MHFHFRKFVFVAGDDRVLLARSPGADLAMRIIPIV
jgi:hypothetical protein